MDGVTQRRRAVVAGTQTTFENTTAVVSVDQLPDTGLFLFRIISAADPTRDTLVRVCTAGDMLSVGRDRVEAVRIGATAYRASSITRSFTDVRVADEDAKYTLELLSRLEDSWAVYVGPYDTSDMDDGHQSYTLPLGDESVIGALTAAYLAARSAREAKESAIETTTSAAAAATAEVARLEALLTALQPLAQQLDVGVSAAGSAATAADALATQIAATLSVLQAGLAAYADEDQDAEPSYAFFGDPEPDEEGEEDEGSVVLAARTWGDRVQAVAASAAGLRTSRAAIAAAGSTLGAVVTSTQGSLTTAVAAAAALAGQLTTQNAELTSLEAAEEAALDALQAADPAYTPPA